MELLLGLVILVLGLFLAIVLPVAAWRISQDLPKMINRLNTIITILKDT